MLKDDITVGLNIFNSMLINLEWDYPNIDKQYSKVILRLINEEDVPISMSEITWYSPKDEMSDVFFKILIRLAETKFIESDHDKDELEEFVKVHSLPKILEDIKEYLLEDGLLEEFQEEIVAHETIYNALGLKVVE